MQKHTHISIRITPVTLKTQSGDDSNFDLTLNHINVVVLLVIMQCGVLNNTAKGHQMLNSATMRASYSHKAYCLPTYGAFLSPLPGDCVQMCEDAEGEK